MTQDGNNAEGSSRVVPLRRKPIGRKCPVCSKPASEDYRPFCSRRCADIDLGRWFKEDYRVPAEEGPAEAGIDDDDEGMR